MRGEGSSWRGEGSSLALHSDNCGLLFPALGHLRLLLHQRTVRLLERCLCSGEGQGLFSVKREGLAS